jgi:hypothetical protein
MITVPLDKSKHDRNDFDCEIEALNSYLKVTASHKSKKDNTRTFVLEEGYSSRMYYWILYIDYDTYQPCCLADEIEKKTS